MPLERKDLSVTRRASVARRRRRDERGATTVLVAFLVVAMVLVIGLATDGGRAFSLRRRAQNAADTSALAGAQALFAYQYAVATSSSPNPASIGTAVSAMLTQNGATSGQTCTYVDGTGVNLGVACGALPPAGTSGVAVRGTVEAPTSFMRLAGPTTISISASSTATIQPLGGVAAPFIVCGNPNIGGYNLLESGGSVNATLGLSLGDFDLEGPQVPDCGDPSAKFKGKSDPAVSFVGRDSYASVIQGNGYSSSAFNDVAGQVPCPNGGPFTDCYMVLPIANGPGGTSSNPMLYVTDFGVFHVMSGRGGNARYTAQFIAPSVTVSGSGVAGVACAVGNQVCVAQLLG